MQGRSETNRQTEADRERVAGAEITKRVYSHILRHTVAQRLSLAPNIWSEWCFHLLQRGLHVHAVLQTVSRILREKGVEIAGTY